MHKEADYIVSYAKELQELGHPYICILVSKTKHISYLTRQGKKSSQFDNIALLNEKEIEAVTNLALRKFNEEEVLVMPWEEFEKRRALCLINSDSLTTTLSD